MTQIDYLRGLWGLSGGFWLIYCLYISIRSMRFIVNRYEQETDLLETIFFKEHATFTRYLPDFFSSAMYSSHLLICKWGWRIYHNKKMFRDIDNPEMILRNFSTKEIRKIKWYAISGLMFIIHCVLYYIFRYMWPEVFD